MKRTTRTTVGISALLTFAAAGTFTGTIVDSDGIPIRAAVIQTEKGENIFSDDQGWFSFENDRRNEILTVSAGGYSATNRSVASGDSVQIVLHRPEVIKENRPGVVLVSLLGSDGLPVAGEIVSNNGIVPTDLMGQASIVPEGTLNLVLTAEGYRDSVVEVTGQIGVVQNLTVKLIPTEQQKQLSASLTGTVRDETGAAIPNVAVSCINTDYSSVTDANGHFEITGIAAGKYSVMAALWGYDASIVNGVSLAQGSKTERLIMMAKQDPSRKEFSRVMGKVVDPQGMAMAGLTVRIAEKNLSAITDNRGQFVIDSVESGVYTLTTWAEGFDSTEVLDVDFWAGETVTSEIRLKELSEGPAILAGNGAITGVVVSSETSQPISGARVVLKGKRTLDAVTSSDGSFEIQDKPGIYALTVYSDGHETKLIDNVPVVLGKNGRFDVVLDKEGFSTMSKMTIRGVATKSSGAALLKERQQTFEVVDAVASEEFSKAGASSAADAMKQITGATIVDDKYVVVRGLPAKYSIIMLNGSMIPSSDPDENAVNMDIFPTGVIENIRVYKTFQTIRPASFAGGIIDIGTKPFPESKKLTLTAGTGFHSLTTGKDFMTSENGKRFWLGMDDGTRELPQIYQDNTKDQVEEHTSFYGKNLDRDDLPESLASHLAFFDEMAKSLSTEMIGHTKTALPNFDFSVSYGNTIAPKGKKLGYTGSITYKNDRKMKPGSISRSYAVDGPNTPLRVTKDFTVDDSKEKVLWSFLGNTSYELAPNQNIRLDYLHLQSGENAIKNVEGKFPGSERAADMFYTTRLHYTERSMNYLKLAGDNRFNTKRDHIALNWNGSFTKSNQNEPDMRDIYSFRDTSGVWQMVGTMPNPSHSWREVKSTMGTGNLSVEIPFYQWSDDSATVTAGAGWQGEWQEQRNRRVRYSIGGGAQTEAAWDRISEENLGILNVDTSISLSGKDWGITVSDDSRDISQRDGNTQIISQFAQIELPLLQKLSTTIGVRGETAKLYDETIVESKQTDSSAAEMDDFDLLPSVMFTFKPSEKMIVKSAYGKTLVRPSIREKAEYLTEAFTGGASFVGNRNLERSLIHNADLRWELFPKPGDLFAVSGFFKQIKNPIETKFLDNDVRQPINSTSDANIFGTELELVKKLDFVEFLKDFSFNANATFVYSRVNLDEESRKQENYFPDEKSYRPFQGQSPFVLNAFLSHSAKKIRLTSTVYYNVFGERLGELTDVTEPYLWEKPEHLLNLTFTKDLGQQTKLTFKAKNVLNPTKKMVYYFNDVEYLKSSVKSGIDLSLGISSSFPSGK